MKKRDFNTGWRYRAGDSGWQDVTLPHDAQLLEKRRADSEGGSGQGYFPGNLYTYEKRFVPEEDWKGQHVEIWFEGIYRNAVVALNDQVIAKHAYGYTPFAAVLDDAMLAGQENVLTVTVDNSKLPNSRWYTGGGIYRPVSLLVGNPSHIAWQGVRIKTLGIHPVQIQVSTEICGEGIREDEIQIEILDQEKVIAKGQGSGAVIGIPEAQLWSENHPYLYQCHVSLLAGGQIVDEVTESFGIREITWSPQGFFVNGENTLLRGGCVHHDNGIVGAASFPESEWRRVRILKEQGFNAIRSSHNPASTAMLDACDYYGMYVMDETFDMWYVRKTKYDYGQDFRDCWKADTKAMVDNDYNHPSVIMYSIGNEVSEPGKPEGVKQGKEIIDYIKSLDDSRAVTGGMNLMIMSNFAKGKGQYDNVDEEKKTGTDQEGKNSKNGSLIFNTIATFVGPGMNKAGNSDKVDKVTTPILDALDIAGYNYANGRYPMEGEKHPDRIVVGSETFPYELGKNWDMVKKYPYLIGDFMWTSWDYLGEAGIGAWSYTGGMPFNRPYPWLLAGAGVIDILGNPDASCGYARVVWGMTGQPVIGVRPVNHPGVRVSKSVWRGTNAIESWSWRGCTGNKAVVEVFADADSVELLINGNKLGRKKIKDYQAMFKTKYEPGTVEAVAYDAEGREISRSRLTSAEDTAKVAVLPEKSSVKAGEILYANVVIRDAKGTIESNADQLLKVSVEGGELLGFGSANPCTEETYHTGTFTTYYGRAQAIIRAGVAGTIRISVTTGNAADAADALITIKD